MIIGHQKQWNFLRNKFEAGQLGHAYLLSGSVGDEKFKFAKDFIRFVNCPKDQFCNLCDSINYRNYNKDTDKKLCQNCKMIERQGFLDLMTVRSVDSESSVKNEKDMMSIKIDQIRDAQNFLSYKSYYGWFKTIIIDSAERMTFEAQNCFLKNLEEPKGNTIIFLISSKPDLLLPTIISRCQEIKFFKIGKYESSKEEQKILEDLLSIARSDLAIKFQYAKKINFEELNLNKILEILQRYFRDLLLFKIGAIKKMEENFFNHYSIPRVRKVIKLIENINHQLNITNVNPKLALEIVLMEM